MNTLYGSETSVAFCTALQISTLIRKEAEDTLEQYAGLVQHPISMR